MAKAARHADLHRVYVLWAGIPSTSVSFGAYDLASGLVSFCHSWWTRGQPPSLAYVNEEVLGGGGGDEERVYLARSRFASVFFFNCWCLPFRGSIFFLCVCVSLCAFPCRYLFLSVCFFESVFLVPVWYEFAFLCLYDCCVLFWLIFFFWGSIVRNSASPTLIN